MPPPARPRPPAVRGHGLRTFAGVVYPAQCDAMGHMNTPHYVAALDQAMWHLVHALGYEPAWREERREGWADVRFVLDFRSELRAGDLFVVDSAVAETGRSSLVSRHHLRAVDGRLAAELEMTSVYFDLAARRSLPLPAALRAAAEALGAVPPGTRGGGPIGR
jgi:acyl-CoA thioester hydrolase